ncbi:MAG: hypothetical protein J0I28_04630 [Caulobacterales bacterium]|nr:hypothetical protein [Caulobacterales bacterium]
MIKTLAIFCCAAAVCLGLGFTLKQFLSANGVYVDPNLPFLSAMGMLLLYLVVKRFSRE